MSDQPCQPAWLYWFDRLDTDEAIRRAAYMPGIPVIGLPAMRIEEACKKLDDAWAEIFVPGPQHITILRMLIDQAINFSSSAHPTLKDYNRQRSGDFQQSSNLQSIRCLNGLAGVSKSSLVKAFERMCRLDHPGHFVSEGQRLVLRPVRRLGIDGQASVLRILKTLSNPLAVAGKGMSDVGTLMAHVCDWFAATGTCTLVVDEMQFFTQSSTASTRTSQLIMTLANLGPPLIFVANYSLVKKLMLRPQEEKDRLLAAPIFLDPPVVDEQSWADSVKEYVKVSPECFRLGRPDEVIELHRLTAGLYRALRVLLLQAYREAVHLSRPFVSMHEVRLAYRSRFFSGHRRDIEDLASLAVSRAMEERRPDLVCPFAQHFKMSVARTATTNANSEEYRLHLGPLFGAPAALVESTVSAEAQTTLDALRRASNPPSGERINAKVLKMPKTPVVSAQSLTDGAQLFRQVFAKPRPSSNKALKTVERKDENTS
jgi:hypothetical protein